MPPAIHPYVSGRNLLGGALERTVSRDGGASRTVCGRGQQPGRPAAARRYRAPRRPCGRSAVSCAHPFTLSVQNTRPRPNSSTVSLHPGLPRSLQSHASLIVPATRFNFYLDGWAAGPYETLPLSGNGKVMVADNPRTGLACAYTGVLQCHLVGSETEDSQYAVTCSSIAEASRRS